MKCDLCPQPATHTLNLTEKEKATSGAETVNLCHPCFVITGDPVMSRNLFRSYLKEHFRRIGHSNPDAAVEIAFELLKEKEKAVIASHGKRK